MVGKRWIKAAFLVLGQNAIICGGHKSRIKRNILKALRDQSRLYPLATRMGDESMSEWSRGAERVCTYLAFHSAQNLCTTYFQITWTKCALRQDTVVSRLKVPWTNVMRIPPKQRHVHSYGTSSGWDPLLATCLPTSPHPNSSSLC